MTSAIAAETYRQRPVEIQVQAIRWDGSQAGQARIVTWSEGAVSGWFDGEYYLNVESESGGMRAGVGDWIVRSATGEFYACGGDTFEATYELVAPGSVGGDI